MMIMDRKRKRNESVGSWHGQRCAAEARGIVGEGRRTEDEFLGRCEHVEGKGHFVLVAFALQPANQVRRVEHRRCVRESCTGEQEESYEPGRVEHGEQAMHEAIEVSFDALIWRNSQVRRCMCR